MIHRLDEVVLLLEKEALGKEVVIIGHQANLRCLYGYLLGIPLPSIPTLNMPLHTLITLTPSADHLSYHEHRHSIKVSLRQDTSTPLPPPLSSGQPLAQTN